LEPTKEHIDELIAKYLAGEALPDEAVLLDEWKEESAENLRYFNESRSALHIKETRVDTVKLFAGVMSGIEALPVNQGEAKVIGLQKRSYFTPFRIAASLLIVSVVGVLAAMFLNGNFAAPDQLIASASQTQDTMLADGSHVYLNKNTQLTVVGGFNARQRKLKLRGEAFFEVKHDDTKPFVIDAGGVEIKDIGTAFNVKASPQSDSVFVHVTEGVVEMNNGIANLRLEADQSAVYIRSQNTLLLLSHVTMNVDAYRTRIFSFKANTLEEVIRLLNEVYGETVVLKNKKLASCRITVDFNNDSPATIVSIIAETLGLTYEEKDGKFLITGDSCIQ
jgi:transmembrane sensor